MKEIKNKVYELEGLLELADMRPEKFAALKPLIDRRLEEIMGLWRNMPEAAPVEAAPMEAAPMEEDPAEEDPMEEDPDDEPLYLRPEENEPKAEEREEREEREEKIEEKREEKRAERAVSTEKRIALCLNDRFRFTRILGMGDKGEFERRLSRLANAGDFETARDYIVDECYLDPDDADVADLIEIVKTYYD